MPPQPERVEPRTFYIELTLIKGIANKGKSYTYNLFFGRQYSLDLLFSAELLFFEYTYNIMMRGDKSVQV